MTFDRQNSIVAAAVAVLISACILGAAVLANQSANEVRIEQERTKQTRVVACEQIESPEVAALCIAAVKA